SAPDGAQQSTTVRRNTTSSRRRGRPTSRMKPPHGAGWWQPCRPSWERPDAMWGDLWFRLRMLFRSRAMEQDLDAELRTHVLDQTEWRLQQGLPPGDAARQATLDLGSAEALKEECRDAWGVRWIQDAGRDLFFSLRLFRRSPSFYLATIASLALGIG